jgi:hypothetical protein
MLPVKNILREYLKEDDEDDEEEGEKKGEVEEKEEKKEAESVPAVAEEKPAEDLSANTVPTGISFTGNDTDHTAVEEEFEVVEILDEPPEAMDEFEDIEAAAMVLPMEFEELS